MTDFTKALNYSIKPKTKILNFLLNKPFFNFDLYRIRQLPQAQFLKSNIVYSLMMGFHPQIKDDMEEIREHLKFKKIPFKEIYINGDKSIFGAFADYASRLSKRGILRNEVLETARKFAGALAKMLRLNRGVYIKQIEIYLLTGVYPVMYGDIKVKFLPPDYFSKRFAVKRVKKPSVNGKYDSRDALNAYLLEGAYDSYAAFPAIQITHQLSSRNELKNWIDVYWREIKKETDKLNPIILGDVDIDRLATGIWLWDLRDNERLTWDDVDKKIDRFDEDESFWGKDDHIRDKYTPDRVRGPELINNAKSYMNSFYHSRLLE